MARFPRRCPRVYVYDLPEPFQDAGLPGSVDGAFGEPLTTPDEPRVDYRHTNQFSLPQILLHRARCLGRIGHRVLAKTP